MAAGPFRYRMPVRFADVDHAGIVYYPRFYHYFHIAFEEFFRERLGARSYVSLLDDERIGFPAVSSEAEYVAPLRFGDEVEVEMTLGRLGTRSVRFDYVARRCGSGDDSDVDVARGKVVCAVTDLERFRAVELPERLRTLFLGLAG